MRPWLVPLILLTACDPIAAPPPAAPSPSTDPSTVPNAAPPSAEPPAPPLPRAPAPPPPPEAVVAPPAAEPAPEAAQVLVEPLLVDEAGALLPQTEDMPRVDDPLFQDRLHTLWRAIVEDDPELARAFFFPKVAYQKVKAIADPARDWDQRLWKLFVRDVHAYHAELGEEPQRARFISFDFPEGKAEWMKKHREGNAIGYYRVKRPHLVVEDARGKRLRLEITSLISWRGQWHVVHLHGFQ